MAHAAEFEFLDDDQGGGQFIPVGGPVAQLRGLLARNDVDGAVHLYEETGGGARTGLLQEASVASFDLKKAIAHMFKRARDFATAAAVFELANLQAEAAPCFEQANDFVRAAAAWKKCGELIRAAAAFERAGKTDEAIELYGQAGAKEQMAEALARGRRFEAAAALYKDLGNLHAEVETLRAALAATPGSTSAAMRLAQLHAQHGQIPRAVEILMEAARTASSARNDPTLLEYLARLLEAMNNPSAAAKVRARIGQGSPVPAPAPIPVVQAAPAPPSTPA
ncbi:MAG: tetratricopeptide repeat protein, partial [Archangium sp.]